MSILVFARRFLAEYVRNQVNLLLLAVVPVVFVIVVADSLAQASKLLGGQGPAVETASAGWAAAFLAGIAMYFQTAATRDVDRRVVIAGLPAWRLVAARLLTGAVLALFASAIALTALAARTGIEAPWRVSAGTVMFAVIYIAIGALLGTLIRNPVNGTITMLFVWILDIFFGPAMGAMDKPATRGLPTHFVTLWMVDLPSGHGGQPGDLGWALLWTAAAIALAWVVAVARTRRSRTHRPARTDTGWRQTRAAARAAWRDARRNPAMWALFVIVPLVFIWTADWLTPNEQITLTISESGQRVAATFSMPDVHAGTMAPIAIASLAAIVGLFVMADSRDGDRRAAIAGMRPSALLMARLSVLSAAALAATAISLAATAALFDPVMWPTYAAANVLLALTYALVGALLAPVFGRVGGVFVAFLLPFLDIAISQSPMLHPDPGLSIQLLPGYGGSRVLLDGALTHTFDETRPLAYSLIWLTVLLALVILTYRRSIAPKHSSRLSISDRLMSPERQPQ